MKTDYSTLFQYAERFRDAIEKAQKENLFNTDPKFPFFPFACCGDTCLLLGNYLMQQGITSKKIAGRSNLNYPEGNGPTHAWLEVGDFCVDITGDQFKHRNEYFNFSARVYVGELTEFHKLFKIERVSEITALESIQNSTREQLLSLYRKISRYL